MNFLFYNFYSIWTEIFLLFNICMLILFGVMNSNKVIYGYPMITWPIFYLSLLILFFSLILELIKSPMYFSSWNNFLIMDSFSHYAKVLLLMIYVFVMLASIQYNYLEKINNFEFWILILLSMMASFLLLQVNDLLTVYVAMEFQSLIFYMLASFNSISEFSTESGIKYFVLGAFSSAFLLFGTSMLYSFTGLTNFNDLQLFFLDFSNYENKNEILICLVFILMSFLFKFNAAPFHIWTPDVYEGAPTSITMLFIILPKLTILGIMSKLMFLIFYDFINLISPLFVVSILLSSVMGTLGTLYQIKWKRFITYSSISNMSFFLLVNISSNIGSITAVFFYWIIYMIMLLALFMFFIEFRFIKYNKTMQLRYLSSLKAFSMINPLLAMSLTLVLFSMIGMPPLAGFFSKFFMLVFNMKTGMFGLAYFILFFNCISCFYYLRLMKFMYFDKLQNLHLMHNSLSKINSVMLGLSLFILLFLFLDLEFFLILSKLLAFSFIY